MAVYTGINCPACGSEHTEMDGIPDWEGTDYAGPPPAENDPERGLAPGGRCRDCDAAWTEIYELTAARIDVYDEATEDTHDGPTIKRGDAI